MVIDAGSNDTQVTVAGDAVAFLGAVAIVVYLAVGRMLRGWMPLFIYAFPVTFASAVVSFLASVALEGSTFLGEGGTALFGWFFDLKWLVLVLYQGIGPGEPHVNARVTSCTSLFCLQASWVTPWSTTS